MTESPPEKGHASYGVGPQYAKLNEEVRAASLAAPACVHPAVGRCTVEALAAGEPKLLQADPTIRIADPFLQLIHQGGLAFASLLPEGERGTVELTFSSGTVRYQLREWCPSCLSTWAERID